MAKNIGLMLLFCSALLAIEVKGNNITSLPPSARFEIVQSSLVARLTFRLDKYDGSVWQLIRDNDRLGWTQLAVKDLPRIQAGGNMPRFQIFTSGMLAGNTFLLDSQTGQSWQYVALPPPNDSFGVWLPMPLGSR